MRQDLQVLRRVTGAVFDPSRPVMVSLIVTRRCNLACGYCHEYDDHSPPVPLATLRERLDHLARLRTVLVVLTGGEPLLHPDLAAIVAHARARGLVPTVNTNGFLLDRAVVDALNDAGLYAMQVSADAARPNENTRKSLKTLRPKLRLLADHARFRVRVNTVLGAAAPEEALAVAREALAHGFGAKVALLRDGAGHPVALDPETRRAYQRIGALPGRRLGLLGERFQERLAGGEEIAWKCRAGARFFHVCEDGLVHRCPPRWGVGAKPLAGWGREDVLREFRAPKPCTRRCGVAYAHQVSRLDRLRGQP